MEPAAENRGEMIERGRLGKTVGRKRRLYRVGTVGSFSAGPPGHGEVFPDLLKSWVPEPGGQTSAYVSGDLVVIQTIQVDL